MNGVYVKANNWVDAEAAAEAAGGRLLPDRESYRGNRYVLDVDGNKQIIRSGEVGSTSKLRFKLSHQANNLLL